MAINKSYWVVAIQDKTAYGEPDIGFAIVEAADEKVAVREADSQLASLIANGFYRCVAHARSIELGRFYRTRAIINPSGSRDDVESHRFLDPTVTGDLPATLMRLTKEDLVAILMGNADTALQRRLVDALGLIDPTEAAEWRRAFDGYIADERVDPNHNPEARNLCICCDCNDHIYIDGICRVCKKPEE